MDTSESISPAASVGYVVLAAYKPDETLFRRQIESIRNQTYRGFRCLIVADGQPDDVRRLLRACVGDDDRFEVIGFEQRVGFYRNFERGLAAVPLSAPWVALSDQDDAWFPEKLERLLPSLESAALVSGQARVVRHPSGEVLAESTERREVPVDVLPFENHYSGALCVFRGALLEVALPFPAHDHPSQVHDHWLALCAALTGGARVVDDVVQDYVQHDANVLGESAGGRWRWVAALRRRLAEAKADSERSAVRSFRASLFGVSAGWAEVMVDTANERIRTQGSARLGALYGSGHRRVLAIVHALRRGLSGAASMRNALVYAVGTAVELRGRRS
jgi:glycosyltransferase involved in cell wall biosynthesis